MRKPDLSTFCEVCLSDQVCAVHTPGQQEKTNRKADVFRRKAEAEAKTQNVVDVGEGVGESRREAATSGRKKPPVVRRSWRAVVSAGRK